MFIFGQTTLLSFGAIGQRYLALNGSAVSTVDNTAIALDACTLKKLKINIISNTLAVDSILSFSVRLNGFDTLLFINVLPGETGVKSVSSDIAITENDRVNIHIDGSGVLGGVITALLSVIGA